MAGVFTRERAMLADLPADPLRLADWRVRRLRSPFRQLRCQKGPQSSKGGMISSSTLALLASFGLTLVPMAEASFAPQEVAVQAPADQREAEVADRLLRRAQQARRAGRAGTAEDQAARDLEAAEDLARAMDYAEMEEVRREVERENEETIAQWERVEASRRASCLISRDAEKAEEIAEIRLRYGEMIEVQRRIAGPAAAATIEGLERSRDVAIQGLVDSDCKSPGEERFDREREDQIRRMREEMPPLVRRPDGSIGPAD